MAEYIVGYYYHYGEEGKGEEGKEEGKGREREREIFHCLGIFPNFRSNFAEENNITE